MKAERQQPSPQQDLWKISVHVKSKNFNFNLKATKNSSTWKIHQISTLLKLHKFLLQFKSASTTSTPPFLIQQQRKTLKSRFIGAIKKLRRHRSKKQPSAASVAAEKEKYPKIPHPEVKSSINRFKQFAYGEPVLGCSLVIGILSFLFQSFCDKGHRGIMILGSVIFLVTSINKNVSEKFRTVLFTFTVVVATVVLSVMFGFDLSVSELINCVNQIKARSMNFDH